LVFRQKERQGKGKYENRVWVKAWYETGYKACENAKEKEKEDLWEHKILLEW